METQDATLKKMKAAGFRKTPKLHVNFKKLLIFCQSLPMKS